MWGFNSDLDEGMKPEKTSPKSHRKKTILHSGALTIHVNPKYHLQEMQTYHWWLKTKAQLKIAAFQMRQVRWLDYSQLSELSCNHRSLLRNIWYLSSIKNKMWDILEKKEMDGNKSCIQKDPTAGSSCPSPNSWQKRDKIHFYKNFVTAKHCKGGMNTAQSSWARGIGHFCFSTGSFGSTRFFLHSQDGAAQARTPHLGRVIAQVCLGHLPSLFPLIPHPQPPQHEQGLRHFPSHLPNSLAPGKPQSNECGESQVCSLIVVVLWRSQDEVRAENWL